MYQNPGVERFHSQARFDTLRLAVVLALAAAIVGWQLFIPPIIGLADQGDFLRLLGPLGYAPVPKGDEHKYAYVTRTFVQDPGYRDRRFEQMTSGMIPAWVALAFNRLAGHAKEFDVTIFGLTYMLLFLLALARLVYETRTLATHWLACALMLLVLTDVGYVAYWNSLYTEPASYIWFLFLLGESLSLARTDRVSIGQVLRWNAFAVLWVTAKAQNAIFSVPLGAYELAWIGRIGHRSARYAAVAAVAILLCAAVVVYRSVPPQTRMSASYDIVFSAILPGSPAPEADLAALHLRPEYVRYSRTLTWGPGTGIGDEALVNALSSVGANTVAKFYLQRPARMWQRLKTVAPTAFSLRPEFCGNFDRSSGRSPGARSQAVALWSAFHQRCLAPVGLELIGALALAVPGGCVLLLRGASGSSRRWAELATCLAACCLGAFFVAGFGDTWDNVKHQFIFNLLLDTCLVFAFTAVMESLEKVRWTAPFGRGSAP